MQDDQPVKPANIANIVATNQGHLPLTMETPSAKPLTADQVADLVEDGYVVVDARDSAVFGAGHIPGAYNVQMSSSEFEQRVGWVTPLDTSIILVTDKDDDAQRAIYNMAFIALDSRVAGFLEGGIDAWMASGRPVATVPQIDVHTLHHKLNVNGLQVLDVREDDEWDEGHIASAVYMSYKQMPFQMDTLPFTADQQIAVTCATGKRSSTAASMLKRNGYRHVYNVVGGMEAWEHAGMPMIDAEGNVCNV